MFLASDVEKLAQQCKKSPEEVRFSFDFEELNHFL